MLLTVCDSLTAMVTLGLDLVQPWRLVMQHCVQVLQCGLHG